MPIQVIDGPMGSELLARGVPTPLPGWSAHALDTAPDVVRAIHADYARAGADVHTTNTFRTRPTVLGKQWENFARRAVLLAREAVPDGHRVAGGIAPLEDCYSPDLSPIHHDPRGAREQHSALASLLAEEGCDVLLCETFPLVAEAWVAVEESVATGVETWVSFTPGPDGKLLTPNNVAVGAEGAIERGAAAVLVNCLPRDAVPAYLEAIRRKIGTSAQIGAYANSGYVNTRDGWTPVGVAAENYGDHVSRWLDLGARIVGGCCGTGMAHVRATRGRADQRITP